jgi:multisubunit Na+/H+ antiporter MnhB subunit
VSADVTVAPVARSTATSGARTRVESLAPLVGAYLLLATLYAWQAWRRETPTIFSDELETTQISRAIAETGHAARRGEPYGFTSLVPWLTAPFWWLHPVATAYEAIKTVQAFVMAAAIFPAYLLARRLLSPGWAYFAAVAAIAGPALSYAPILVEEPWAYPAATVALWLTVRAVDRPGSWAIASACAACLGAVLVRSQLVALVGALAFGLLALAWRTESMRRWRATWTRWDWVGAAVLGVGAVIVVVAFVGHRSNEWSTATTLWKGRMVEYGSWAGGAFAIGVGILPAVALLAMLAVPRSERERPGVRAFVVVSAGAVVGFGWYAAVKGAYLSTTFSSLIVERNLVYLAPLAFVATAYLLERGTAPLWAVVAAGAGVLGLVVWVPIERGLDNFPYYEAHGLAILALANREWAWPLGRIETAVEVLTVVSVVVLALVGTQVRARLTTIAVPAAVVTAVALLIWNVAAEVYASIGEHDFSFRVETNIPKPNDWIDRAADGGSVVMLGQHMSDNPLAVPSTEFWNRSIGKVWSVDGSGPGPGHTLTPDLQDVDGTLWPNPRTDYVLASGGVEVVGEQVAANTGSTLVRLDGRPIRLSSNETGIAGDGWIVGSPGDPTMPARAAYNRFDVSGDGTGDAVVTLSRETFCPAGKRLPGDAVVRIGVLGRGPDKQPAIVRQTGSESLYVPACAVRTVVLPTPDVPWRVEVTTQTFVPAEVDPKGSGSERRALGARVSFDVRPP